MSPQHSAELDRIAEHCLGVRRISGQIDDKFLVYLADLLLLEVGRRIQGVRGEWQPGGHTVGGQRLGDGDCARPLPLPRAERRRRRRS